MEWSGWGRGGGAPRKEGVQKGTGSGEQTQPPKHWFVELEVMSDRAGGQGLQDWSGRNREGSGSSSLSPPLSQALPLESLPRAPSTPLSRAGGGDRWRPRQQRGLAQVCLLPLRERKERPQYSEQKQSPAPGTV